LFIVPERGQHRKDAATSRTIAARLIPGTAILPRRTAPTSGDIGPATRGAQSLALSEFTLR